MNTTDLNWKTWLEHGDQYLKAGSAKSENSRLGTDIRYNLLSIALESYVMAIMDFHQSLPENHTYTDLLSALEQTIPLDKTLKERILKYENIQSICSLEKYHHRPPSGEELADLQGAIVEISKIAYKETSVSL